MLSDLVNTITFPSCHDFIAQASRRWEYLCNHANILLEEISPYLLQLLSPSPLSRSTFQTPLCALRPALRCDYAAWLVLPDTRDRAEIRET